MPTKTVAAEFHLAGRPMTLAGRKVLVGQPVPESVVTWTLLELAWIVSATRSEFEAAVQKHGRPPEALYVGWDYVPNGQAPGRTKMTRKTRTKARRKKARGR